MDQKRRQKETITYCVIPGGAFSDPESILATTWPFYIPSIPFQIKS
jgi:hypothetical protein